MTSSFILDEIELRRRGNLKWTTYGPEVLPAFVAEMDYSVAPAIHQAMRRVVDGQEYGYPPRSGSRTPAFAAQLYSKRMLGKFGWKMDPELVVVCSDLVQAIFATIMAFSEQGDFVAMQNPCYPPFREAIDTTKRSLLPIRATDDGQRFSFDIEELKRSLTPQAKLLMFCNPHNPTGRVYTRQELQDVADFVCEQNLLVVSDEIHSEITYGQNKHIPLASLNEDIGKRTITLGSAAKAFNLAGLKCAFIHFGTDGLRDRFLSSFPKRVITPGHVTGVDATVAAWEHGGDWQSSVIAYLEARRSQLLERLSNEMPAIGCYAPEGTYMAWLDCRKLNLLGSAYSFFLQHAKVALSAGEAFEPKSPEFARINFATSQPILDEIIDRMVAALPRSSDRKQ